MTKPKKRKSSVAAVCSLPEFIRSLDDIPEMTEEHYKALASIGNPVTKSTDTYDQRLLMEKIAIKLMRAMRAKNLTRRDVADRANVTVEYIDDFLEGRVKDIETGSLHSLFFACGARIEFEFRKKTLP